MRDLEERNGRYFFLISGDDQDFFDAKEAVKEAFVWRQEREYNPETHEWSVPANSSSEERLLQIFGNAAECFRNLHSQMKMFDI